MQGVESGHGPGDPVRCVLLLHRGRQRQQLGDELAVGAGGEAHAVTHDLRSAVTETEHAKYI